jgi:hypothetical protein
MISTILSAIIVATFIATTTDEIPQPREIKITATQEYAEEPKKLEYNEYIGYYYSI